MNSHHDCGSEVVKMFPCRRSCQADEIIHVDLDKVVELG